MKSEYHSGIEPGEITWFNSSVWKPVKNMFLPVAGENQQRCWGLSPPFEQALRDWPIYKLLEFIHSEARRVELTAKLVSGGAVGMTKSKKTTEKQAWLTTLWEKYGGANIIIS